MSASASFWSRYGDTGRRALWAALAVAWLLTPTVLGAQRNGRTPGLTGGNNLLYVGTYAGNVQIFDEATERLAGEIKLKTGIPRSLVMSFNKQRFYVLDSTYEKIEIVDIATRSTVDTFTLSSGPTRTQLCRQYQGL